jgi:hypothetical protein
MLRVQRRLAIACRSERGLQMVACARDEWQGGGMRRPLERVQRAEHDFQRVGASRIDLERQQRPVEGHELLLEIAEKRRA